MFDDDRLFRVLYYLAHEPRDFLVAQDALATIRSCINQIENVDFILNDLIAKREELDEKYEEKRQEHQNCIDKLESMKARKATLLEFLCPLRDQAADFWFCSPVDQSHHMREVADQGEAHMERWRRYRDADDNIHPEIRHKIVRFRSQCESVLESQYADMLLELCDEESAEEEVRKLVRARHRSTRFMNKMPLSLVEDFGQVHNSFIGSSRFPVTHYHNVDPEFSSLMGFSIARMFAFPLLSFGVNTKETNDIVNQLASTSQAKPSVATLFYRTVTREVLCVHWEITTSPLDGTYYARGVDVSNEIEASRLRQAVSIQKMLRQWLHSIRNASFEQQATVILEEVNALQAKVSSTEFETEFRSIRECVKLLMHTAKTSVGLIDQALDTRGFIQHMCAGDFVSNIVSFPHHFAQSEGLAGIYTKFRFLLNGVSAQPSDFLTMFVSGEVVNIQSVVDNIISNAVRYTDPIKGIEVQLSADQHEDKLNFLLKITDFAEGGLPPSAVKYLQDGLGASKCLRVGGYDSEVAGRSVHKGRSSRTGLPHIVETYHQMTQAGSGDFDINVRTSADGTCFRVRFAMRLMAPMSVSTAAEHIGTPIVGTVVVADDSMVIRKIISRYLTASHCTHHLCSDGEEAWQWIQRHSSVCAALITDLEMPKMGGDTLVTLMRDFFPDIPCFIVSGNDISLEKLPQGARRAIVKPITSEQVQTILDEVSNLQSP